MLSAISLYAVDSDVKIKKSFIRSNSVLNYRTTGPVNVTFIFDREESCPAQKPPSWQDKKL